MTKRPAEGRDSLPESQPAALAALSISESLILTLVESGIVDPHTMRRCLLDAATAYDNGHSDRIDPDFARQAADLIDHLLRQVDAVAPSSAAPKPYDRALR